MTPEIHHFQATSHTEFVRKIEARLVGRRLIGVERREYDWVFSFEDNIAINASTPWRIVVDGRNRFGDCDDGQQFGLPAPIDGPKLATELLLNKPIRGVSIREDTGDLAIAFDSVILEIVHISSGYEGWGLNAGNLELVVQGGGQLAIWER